VIRFTNAARFQYAASGPASTLLKPLTENFILDSVAMAKARDIFANQYFEHISPVTGKGPSDLDTADP
jgi:uncharacterized protein YkwD